MSKFDNEIINMYNNEIPVSEIIKILPCCKQTVYDVLNKYHINLRGRSGKRDDGVSDLQIYEMYELYQQGKNTREIGELYNLSSSYVSRLFHQKSFKLRDQHDNSRRYHFDECFFDDIDTQEKAYYLGLLWADGTNILNRNCIQIGLQEKDKYILEHMLIAMNANYTLRCTKSTYPGGQDIYSISLFSEHMSNKLNDIGMIPNKSLILKFPTCVPDNLMSHFIRGVFDGDGYISHGGDYTCEIMGTEDFCIELQRKLLEAGIDSKIYNTTLRKETSTRRLYIGKKDNVRKFLNYIYKNSTIYLERKHEIALSKYKYINNTLTA